MIVDTPAEKLVTIPLLLPIVATAVTLLLHVPPVVELERVVPVPAHITIVPVIAPGFGFVVTACVTKQPAGNI